MNNMSIILEEGLLSLGIIIHNSFCNPLLHDVSILWEPKFTQSVTLKYTIKTL